MSYHGLGQLTLGPTGFRAPTLVPTSTGTRKTTAKKRGSFPSRSTSAMTPQVAWLHLMLLRTWLPRYGAALRLLLHRAPAADRPAIHDALAPVDRASALASAIYNFETVRGTRAFRGWSTGSIQKLGDLGQTGAIPTAAMVGVMERTKNSTAIHAAAMVKSGWAALVPWLAAQTPRTLVVRTANTRVAPPPPPPPPPPAEEDVTVQVEEDETVSPEETAEAFMTDPGDFLLDDRDLHLPAPASQALIPKQKFPWLWVGLGVAVVGGGVGWYMMRKK